jgi:hypothetical protein
MAAFTAKNERVQDSRPIFARDVALSPKGYITLTRGLKRCVCSIASAYHLVNLESERSSLAFRMRIQRIIAYGELILDCLYTKSFINACKLRKLLACAL